MPGIVGIISKNSPEKNIADVNAMIHSMMHEPFYSSGTLLNGELGVYAGWVCHKDSFCDCMPIWNEKKNMVLIYFGENFTDLDLFNQLKGKNHRFDDTNATYLIHLYEERGQDFLKDLNGWFSGLLIDLQLNKVILFNDRYGMQKIFYHEGVDAFHFASEAKALLEVCPELRQLDMNGISELLCYECVLENRSLFKEVFLLPAAAKWTFQENSIIKKDNYFTPDTWENQPWLERDFFYNKLKETFKRILPRYFRTKRKIAISLTGGLDTRMLLANKQLAANKYPCYTFGGIYRDCYDVKVARKVAAAIDQIHQTITVDNVFLGNFSDYAEKTVFITDGYLNVGGAPEMYVNKQAREIAPIRMTGNFGSEVLRNVRNLKASKFINKAFLSEVNNYVLTANILEKYKKKYDNPLSFTLFIEAPWHENNRLVCEQSQLTLRTPYLDNDLVSLMYSAPMDVRNSKNNSLRLITDGNPLLARIPSDRGYGGNLIYPFNKLSYVFYDFLAKAEYAYNYGMPQWLARIDYTFKVMHFEKLFLGRHKYYHFRLWYRDQLADYVKAVLLDDKTLKRPYLNRKNVEAMVEGHTKGYHNYTTEITQLLTVELIQRLLIEK